MLRPLLGVAALTAAGATASVTAPAALASVPPASPTAVSARGPAAPSVASLVAAAGRALTGQSRVHLEGVMSQIVNGVGVYVSVGIDAGSRYGTLSETIASKGRQVRFGALLTPGRAYCTGDPNALAAGCTMSPASAVAAAGRWVSFAPGTVAYSAVAAMVQFTHDTAGLLPAGRASGFAVYKRATLGGQPVIELRGPASPSSGFPAGTVETLAIAARGAPLPVAVEMHKPGRVDESERFSRWGDRFTVRVPRTALRG